MEKKITAIIELHKETILKLENKIPEISEAARKIISSLKDSNKILICGNGGSAADAQHMAAEFIGRFKKDRKPLPAVALTTDSSVLTSLGNDFGFKTVFSKQVEALGEKGDILILISTSGKSENLIEAALSAEKAGMFSIALLGKDGGRLKDRAGISIVVPSMDTARIQEAHSLIIHTICELVEYSLFH